MSTFSHYEGIGVWLREQIGYYLNIIWENEKELGKGEIIIYISCISCSLALDFIFYWVYRFIL